VSDVDGLQTGTDELRRSRALVVAAGDAERRRIERELHDGPQQRLVAIAVGLQQARLLVQPDDPAELGELLDAVAEDVRAALSELRELAARIHPPLLEGQGLAAGLRAAVSRVPITVEIDSEPLGALPEPVAAALHFSCLDAVENAASHAGPDAHVRVALRSNEENVSFEVVDEGTGFDPAGTAPGAGFARIADRVGTLGGRVSIESSPGGRTRLVGEIPLRG
jgi:signal transduction histidine kinase